MAEGNFSADGSLENVGKATGTSDQVAEGMLFRQAASNLRI